MFSFTKKFILATIFMALFSGQNIAYGSQEDPSDGESKRQNIIAKVDGNAAQQVVDAPIRNAPLFGRIDRNIKLIIVDYLDGASAKNFAISCYEASNLVRLSGRVTLVRHEGMLSQEQMQLLQSHLKRLNLSLCVIGTAGAQSLALEIGKLVNFTVLDLANNQIGTAVAQSLAPELGKLVKLRQLSLANNQIGDYGFGCLSTYMLFLSNTPGAVIHLENNNITEQIRAMPHPAYFRL